MRIDEVDAGDRALDLDGLRAIEAAEAVVSERRRCGRAIATAIHAESKNHRDTSFVLRMAVSSDSTVRITRCVIVPCPSAAK